MRSRNYVPDYIPLFTALSIPEAAPHYGVELYRLKEGRCRQELNRKEETGEVGGVNSVVMTAGQKSPASKMKAGLEVILIWGL
jgi:hypothetical protein